MGTTGIRTTGIGTVGRYRTRAVVLAAVLVVLATALGWALQHPGGTRLPAVRAMSPECHQAYWGYLQAFDQPEADFWAESWVEFGCESDSSGLVA